MTTIALTACEGESASPQPPAPVEDEHPATAPVVAPSPGMQAPRPQAYEPAAESTVSGVVASVRVVDQRGLHVELTVGDETLEVHLGPSWYAEEIGLAPKVGERFEVTGSRSDGVMLARRVVRGAESWTLRDAAGRPAWSGRGRA